MYNTTSYSSDPGHTIKLSNRAFQNIIIRILLYGIWLIAIPSIASASESKESDTTESDTSNYQLMGGDGSGCCGWEQNLDGDMFNVNPSGRVGIGMEEFDELSHDFAVGGSFRLEGALNAQDAIQAAGDISTEGNFSMDGTFNNEAKARAGEGFRMPIFNEAGEQIDIPLTHAMVRQLARLYDEAYQYEGENEAVIPSGSEETINASLDDMFELDLASQTDDCGNFLSSFIDGNPATIPTWNETIKNATSVLHPCPVNTYVGIGTSSPDEQLHVGGNALITGELSVESGITFSENLGIGTTDPQYPVHIAEESYFDGNASIGEVLTVGEAYDHPSWTTDDVAVIHGSTSIHGNTNILNGRLTIDRSAQDEWNTGLAIDMGKEKATALTVAYKGDRRLELRANGLINARAVRITEDNEDFDEWFPDYVFDEDYELMSLKELAAYIDTNKSLPGVPTAREVSEDGYIDLAELQIVTLEKVEEHALYAIQLAKENRKLEKRIEELEEQVQEKEALEEKLRNLDERVSNIETEAERLEQ